MCSRFVHAEVSVSVLQFFFHWIILCCMDIPHAAIRWGLGQFYFFWWLCITLLWTFMYTCLYGCVFLVIPYIALTWASLSLGLLAYQYIRTDPHNVAAPLEVDTLSFWTPCCQHMEFGACELWGQMEALPLKNKTLFTQTRILENYERKTIVMSTKLRDRTMKCQLLQPRIRPSIVSPEWASQCPRGLQRRANSCSYIPTRFSQIGLPWVELKPNTEHSAPGQPA